jgi:hypothetical protein
MDKLSDSKGRWVADHWGVVVGDLLAERCAFRAHRLPEVRVFNLLPRLQQPVLTHPPPQLDPSESLNPAPGPKLVSRHVS